MSHLHDADAARAQLQARGWIARKSEAFHHLPPPPLAQWLGAEDTAPTATSTWTLRTEGQTDAVQARWLDALIPAERAALFAGLPTPQDGEAAPFAWAQRALCRQGLRIQVAATEASHSPVTLHLEHHSAPEPSAPLLVVELAPGARCRLIETHHGAQSDTPAGAQNLHIHIELGDGAELEHLRLCPHSPEGITAHHLHARLHDAAQYRQALVAHSSRYHLQRQHISLQGRASSAHSAALLLAPGAQIDQQTRTDMLAADTASTVETLVLAQGKAHAVANAYTHIGPGSREANVRQRLSGVPLAGNPRLILRPHLEILHDQVQAAHGATWGALPEDALFYARQRGLDEASARALIIDGMARALLQRCLGDADDGLLGQWLENGWLDARIDEQARLALSAASGAVHD